MHTPEKNRPGKSRLGKKTLVKNRSMAQGGGKWVLPATATAVSATLLLLLGGCQPAVRDEPADQLAPLKIDPAAVLYSVQPGESRLTVLVYRAGRLANMGHNHVISSVALSGEVYLAEEHAATALELRLPVGSLTVDIPELRAAAGADFPGELDQEARDGTRSNMLGERQLNAAAWPEIILRSRAVSGALPDLEVSVDIAVRDQIRRLTVPVSVLVSQGRLTATGRFSVNQTDLGLEPFSVMMGALSVRDQLDIEFSLVAVTAAPWQPHARNRSLPEP
jgi:hypothetical protein